MNNKILLPILLIPFALVASPVDVEWSNETTSFFQDIKTSVSDEDLALANGRLYSFESEIPVYIAIKRKHPATKKVSIWRSHTPSKSFHVGLAYRTEKQTNTITGDIFTRIDDQFGFSDTHTKRASGGAFASDKPTPPYWAEKWFEEHTIDVDTDFSLFTADVINEWFVTIKFSTELNKDENLSSHTTPASAPR